VFLFGLIATLQVFVTNRKGFLVTRSLLGVCEAGYIPGALYTLSTWYTRRELATRVAIFYFGLFGGNAIGPLLASGILKLDGHHGLKGWQWLFLSKSNADSNVRMLGVSLCRCSSSGPATSSEHASDNALIVEGIFTMVVSISLLFLLPGSPDSPRPLLSPGIVRFSPTARDALKKRLEGDDKEKKNGAQEMRIPLAVVWKTVMHYRRWPHFFSAFAVFSTWSPLTTYTPSIIMTLGFDRVQANALASVGGFMALVVVFFFGYVSDRTNRRGLTVISSQLCYLIVLIVARQTQHHDIGKWSRWGLWTTVNAFAVGYHPAHTSWMKINCKEPGERSISISMWVMSAISGLMAGTQYFRADDLPL
jgi:MFS family permease